MPTEIASPLQRDLWLQARMQGIGASEAAAVAGVSPYDTPGHIWQRKMGFARDKQPTFKMQLGLAVEDAIKNEWERINYRTIENRNPALYAMDNAPFVLATPDAVIDSSGQELIECKYTSGFTQLGEEGTDDLPVPWIYQAQQQMLVMGAAVVHFAVLVDLQKIKLFQVERHEGLQEHILNADTEFWGFVTARQPPPLDWEHPQTPAFIKEMYKTVSNRRVLLSDEMAGVYQQMVTLQAKAKAYEQEIEVLKGRLLAEAGDAGIAEIPGTGMELRRQWREPVEMSYTKAGYVHTMFCKVPVVKNKKRKGA